MKNKILTIGIIYILIAIVFLSIIPENVSAENNANLVMNQTDISITDKNGNEVSQITLGETITIKATIHNIGNENSYETDVQIWVFCKVWTLTNKEGDKESGFAILKEYSGIIIPANGKKELTISWKTDEKIGTSIYYANPGTYYFNVKYGPTDWDIELTDENSDSVSSHEITLVQPSKPEPKGFIPSFEAVYLVAIIGIYAMLLKGRRMEKTLR